MHQHPLASVRRKLARAEHQMHALHKSMDRWAQRDLVEGFTDRDRQGRVCVRVERAPEIPAQFYLRIGECVHNFRGALDHLAYQLNILGSGRTPPPNFKQSAFPLFDCGPEFRGTAGKGKGATSMVKFFPPKALAATELLQPYIRRQDRSLRDLAVLRELSNIDKHRRFPLATSVMPGIMYRAHVGAHELARREVFDRLLKPNTTIIRLTVPTLPPRVKPHVDVSYMLTIEFERGDPPEQIPLPHAHEPVPEVLRAIRDCIQNRVLPEFERFFPALAAHRAA